MHAFALANCGSYCDVSDCNFSVTYHIAYGCIASDRLETVNILGGISVQIE